MNDMPNQSTQAQVSFENILANTSILFQKLFAYSRSLVGVVSLIALCVCYQKQGKFLPQV
jgi:hypothetical protein